MKKLYTLLSRKDKEKYAVNLKRLILEKLISLAKK